MFKLTKLQKEFVVGIFKMTLLFPPMYFFVLAMLPIGKDPILYIMLTSFYWILFIVSIIGAVWIGMFLEHPEMRSNFLHLDRRPRKKGSDAPTSFDQGKKRKPADSV
jgi:hypothetical protein